MDCFICGGVAEDISGRAFDGKIVRCPDCGDYEITGTAMTLFIGMSEKGRRNALENAKRLAPVNSTPVISSYRI